MDIHKIDTDLNLFDPERQYRDFYNAVPVACFTVNTADGRILNFNREAQRLLGYTGNAMLQMKIFELYADTLHGLPKAQKIFKEFNAGKSIRDIELQVKHRNGKLRWVSLSVEPEHDPDGGAVKSRFMMVDISDRREAEIALQESYSDIQNLVDKHTAELVEENTRLKKEIEERKQAEIALRESENSFKKLAESADDGILLIESDGKALYANVWFEKISGYSVSKILKGSGTSRLIDQAIGEMHLKKLRNRLAVESAPSRHEAEIITSAGQAVSVEFSASKTIWQGKPVILLIVRDITSQKQTEAKLLREQLILENRVKERTRELVDTNKALFVLARNIDKRREKFQEKTSRIVNSKIMPIIEGIQKNQLATDSQMEYDVLKAYLNELSQDPKDELCITFILSNAELRVANMIKNGFTSSQIARLLNISSDTVKTHRKNIRKKLNIRNSKINLRTYLRAKLK